ncbi:hypothetical protein [Asticcacaulis excentricus]|uniref:Uncharacterized protein n=1 Tax=Asticcacaulis excentricus (strain ATCC 15261 / DSM 4724 / KCTC 12464 / NCIMB 9791 / VKM B-1370 / CB 48) TaxID=573065 RepID=E8RMN9_ASTEC|nr:hypothetical protein [Asticcacaulis excentricus]ADU13920.1 hypothetical protein Astex_2265 [Asticcacaulis excentricus CB 48]
MLQVSKFFSQNDSYYFYYNGDLIRMRSHDGGTLPLSPGWTPSRIILGMKHVNIVEVVHESGSTGLWLLNSHYRFVTHDAQHISESARSELFTHFPQWPILDWGSLHFDQLAPAELSANPIDYRLNVLDNKYINGVKIFNSKSIQEIEQLKAFWLENEYLKIENALTPEAVALIDKHVTFNHREALDDPRQFYRMHNDGECGDFIDQFHMAAHEYYELLLSSELLRCAAFAMKYVRNSDLLPHYDNILTQISSTVCYKFGPDGAENPLFLDRAKFLNPYQQRVTVKDKENIPSENIVRIDLKPGDLAIFRGRTHLHWREAIDGEMDFRAVLIHFSESQYNGTMLRPGPVEDIPYHLIDFDDYRAFREKYAVYFERAGMRYT